MPTYDYYCEKCKKTVEIFHSIKDTKIQLCKICQTPLDKKISGGAGFILKGAGFYRNDYPKT